VTKYVGDLVTSPWRGIPGWSTSVTGKAGALTGSVVDRVEAEWYPIIGLEERTSQMEVRQAVPQVAISKIAEVTLCFWIMKVLATTLGETAGDYISMSLGLGYYAGLGVTFAMLALVLVPQIAGTTYRGLLRARSRDQRSAPYSGERCWRCDWYLASTVSAALFRQAFIALLIQGGYEIAVNALRNSRDRCAAAKCRFLRSAGLSSDASA
jgi:hypothetical protein